MSTEGMKSEDGQGKMERDAVQRTSSVLSAQGVGRACPMTVLVSRYRADLLYFKKTTESVSVLWYSWFSVHRTSTS